MGGRLSIPKAADGMSEISKPTSGSASARLSRNRGIINGRVSLFKHYPTFYRIF